MFDLDILNTGNLMLQLYTIEGEPVIKRKCDYKTNNIKKNLEIISQWQCVLHDKWIIGVELHNRLQW